MAKRASVFAALWFYSKADRPKCAFNYWFVARGRGNNRSLPDRLALLPTRR